jgi:hypothetical protein
MPSVLKWFFEFQYRFGKPRWDTGVTPIVAAIEAQQHAGLFADIGCDFSCAPRR